MKADWNLKATFPHGFHQQFHIRVHASPFTTNKHFFLSKALIKLIAVVKAKLFFDFTRFLICFFTQSYALFIDHYQKHRHYVRECKLKHTSYVE